MRDICRSFYFRVFCVLLLVFMLYSFVLKIFIEPITSIDLRILHWVRGSFSFIPLSVVVFITDLGISTTFLGCYAFVAGYFLALKKYMTIVVLLANFFLFVPAIHLAKSLFLRERPDVLLHRIAETGYSYPSGHSSTAFFIGLLGLFFVSKTLFHVNVKRVLSVIIFIWMLLLPLSRVWLGVHYPTDIIGGAIYGSLLACLTLTIIQKDYEN